MDRKDEAHNPSNPRYTFNGRNTNFQFGYPGDYQIQMSSPRGAAETPTSFHTYEKTVTTVLLPNSRALSDVPPSPGRTQSAAGPGIERSLSRSESFSVPATPPPRGSPHQTNRFLGTASPVGNQGVNAAKESPLKASPSPRGSHPSTPGPLN